MITIKDIIKKYNKQVVLNIPELEIKKDELIGLVGNNGAGKSTLFKLMLDLIKADEGEISINNIPVTEQENWKLFTSAYLDNSFLLEYLTPTEYFETIGVMSNLNKDELNSRLTKYEKYLGEDNLSNKKYIRNLSAGNQQKVGIVGALLSNPSLLILDEPFNYLDPTSQENTKIILNRYREESGSTIIVSSHNLEHVLTISTRVLLLEGGVIKKDLVDDHEAIAQEIHEYFKTELLSEDSEDKEPDQK